MGADLFGSYAEATCAALVIAATCNDLVDEGWAAIVFPMEVCCMEGFRMMCKALFPSCLMASRTASALLMLAKFGDFHFFCSFFGFPSGSGDDFLCVVVMETTKVDAVNGDRLGA